MNKVTAVVLVLAACGGGSAQVKPRPVAGSDLGDCVMPGAGYQASFRGLDGAAVAFCGDDPTTRAVDDADCRAVDVATGAMRAWFPPRAAATATSLSATIEPNLTLKVCRGESCLTRPPASFEKWIAVAVDGDGVVALAGRAQQRWITVLDKALVETARFEVGWGSDEVLALSGRFRIIDRDANDRTANLYGADGTYRGPVGGDEHRRYAWGDPVALAPARWAFFEPGGRIQVHDLETGETSRLADVTETEAADAMIAVDDHRVALVHGRDRYGDVVIVDVVTGAAIVWRARSCAEDA